MNSPSDIGRRLVQPAMIAGIALVYFALVNFCRTGPIEGFQYALFVFPNGWLLVASLLLSKKLGLDFSLTKGGVRVLVGIVPIFLFLAAIWGMTVAWPDRSFGFSRNAWVKHSLIVFLVPVAEELFFRGILLERLSSSLKSSILGTLLVSALFGLAHLPQGEVMVITMSILSLFLCTCTLLTKSLIWPVALHIGWNSLAVIRTLPPGSERLVAAGIVSAVLIVMAVRGIHTRTVSNQER